MNIKFRGKIDFVKNDFKDEVFDISDNIYAYSELDVNTDGKNKNRSFIINEDTNV